jgi:hypothetical protein
MADFSCYVQIVNKTSSPVNLNGTPVCKEGKYISDPPDSIAPGNTINFQIQQADASAPGPEGSCEYSITDQHGVTGNVVFSYSCPVKGTNATDALTAGNPAVKIQMIPNPLPQYGHPVNVQFSILNG